MYEPTWSSFNTSHNSKTKAISLNDQWFGQCWFYSFKRQFFSPGSFVVCVWRQRSSDQDDYKGKKPDHETRFQNPTELLLIGYSIESIWSPKSKSNTLTPKTNSQTYWPREISHVMNGIIFCVCLTFAISVLPIVQKWCRKEHQKDTGEEKSHSKIEADDAFGLAMQRKESWRACLYCIRKPRWKADMKVNYLWARGLSSI